MSWFNAKAFATGAIEELSDKIDRNVDEAKTYEDEQREIAKQSRRTISQRRGVVNVLVSEAKRLESLGVSKSQIQAAHSSGPSGLMELSKAVMAEVKRRGGRDRFMSEYDVKAMIDSTAITPEFKDMEYEEFISRSMGLGEQGAPEVATERNLLQRAFGYKAKDAVRAKLDREMQGGSMSLLDINEAANRAAYESAMPGSFATFSPAEYYDNEAALKHHTSAMKQINAGLINDLKYKELLTLDDGGAAHKQYRRQLISSHAMTQFKRYGKESINDPVIKWDSANLLGPELYAELVLELGFSEVVTGPLAEKVVDKTNVITLDSGPKLTTGIDGTVTSIELNGANGNRVITDPDKIKTILDRFEMDGMIYPNAEGKITGMSTTQPPLDSIEDALGTPQTVTPDPSLLEAVQPAFDAIEKQAAEEAGKVKVKTTGFANMGEAQLARSTLEVGAVVDIAGKKYKVTTVTPDDPTSNPNKYFVEVEEAEPLTVGATNRKEAVDAFNKVTGFLGNLFSGDGEETFLINIPALEKPNSAGVMPAKKQYLKVSAETLALIKRVAPELLDDTAFIEEFGSQEVDDAKLERSQMRTNSVKSNDRQIKEMLEKAGYIIEDEVE